MLTGQEPSLPAFDPERAERTFGVLSDDQCHFSDHQRGFLHGVFANSGYLARIAAREPEFLSAILVQPPDTSFNNLLQPFISGVFDGDQPQLMAALRRLKRQAALLIALADIAEVWSVDAVTAALSRLAEVALQAAVRWLLCDAKKRGELALPDSEQPEVGSGFIILGMGKLGAHELNYSSDIDVIVLFDGEQVPYTGRRTAQQMYVKLTQNLVKILQEITKDGYVFRTDLRLRPDPGVTPVVLSTAAAEQYYESMGQNWERAAMIKARAVAGDLAAGETFLKHLHPFVWRRHLDFAAIQDVHSIKRQIHAHRGHHEIGIAGHNLKVGRGGIRDIEFFVQTQQLIAGGRDTHLRCRETLTGLERLADAGWIKPDVVGDLSEAYRRLRRLEHRLQMLEDQQIHSLPDSADGLRNMAYFAGFADEDAFHHHVLNTLATVQRHYAVLFENAPSLAADQGNMVFTGADDDPGTLATLAEMGYQDGARVSATLRGWHHGRYAATKSTRSRQLLTELTPILLTEFANTDEPDAAIARLDRFLSGLPAGVQLFSMFRAHPTLLNLLSEILGSAPRLADYLTRNAGVLDAVLSEDFFTPLPPVDNLIASLQGGLRVAQDYADALDVTRRFAKERKFQLGVQLLKGTTDAYDAARGYSDLADAVIAGLIPEVEAEFAKRHGRVPGGVIAVVAFGKLGSQEMTATSDLDLIFLYDVLDADGQSVEQAVSAQSDGARPLQAPHYFARLCQRVLNALTTLTPEGALYEVDMRLRPSGNKGPLVTHVAGFAEYQQKHAWLWEHMALTRARVVYGPAALVQRTEGIIHGVLSQPRDQADVAKGVWDMRQRMARQKPATDPWELKQVAGGLVDLEFISQYLALVYGTTCPRVLTHDTVSRFSIMAESGELSDPYAKTLSQAHRFQSDLSAVLSVAVEGTFSPETVPEGLRRALLRLTGAASLKALQNQLEGVQKDVRSLFETILGPPDEREVRRQPASGAD